MLWASGNDWDREWIQQVVTLLVGHGAFTLYPELSQCDNAAERLTRWLTFQLPRIKKAHPGCPIHQWLNSIGAQVIVEKWQSPEQWPNLYWLPLPEVEGTRARRVGFVTGTFVTGISELHEPNQHIASKHTGQRLYLLVHFAFI